VVVALVEQRHFEIGHATEALGRAQAREAPANDHDSLHRLGEGSDVRDMRLEDEVRVVEESLGRER
jgi:hypothetical protein